MFDKKAWREANRDKCKLYSVRYRLKQKGLLSPETTEQMMAEREAKKIASAERARQRKREWAAANKHRKNERYRERYHSDPEFRRREIDKRMAAFKPTQTDRAEIKAKKLAEKMALKQAQLESRVRAREEDRLKKKKLENAKRHALAMEKAEKIPPKKPKVTMKTRKPGRLVALSGWMGW
jgi:hypothetical protein